MILSSHIHEQLSAAQRRDLLAAADRRRLAALARPHDRRPVRMHALRRDARKRCPVEFYVGTSARRTAAP